VDAEGVDHAVGDEEGRVDADGFGGRGLVGGFYGCDGRDEAGAAEGYAGGDADLAEEVEPGGRLLAGV
jgi:hypothetical protein